MSSGASGEIHAHHDRSYSSYPCVDRWHFYSGNAEAAESGGRDLSDLRGRDWTRAAEIASHLALSRSVYASIQSVLLVLITLVAPACMAIRDNYSHFIMGGRRHRFAA